ncbi:glycosyltransferase [Clostridium sp.]|uniref:cytidylyltransferase domain-containing protein n=1 Tax=Clostridium sp. TaxID=1506 RepID=UPI0032167CEB
MYNGKSILVCIPARGGSKGIPRKNVRLMNNNPLISYVINTAKSSSLVDEVIVSTDDVEIKEVSQKYGTLVVDRDGKFSEDSIPLDPVINDAVGQIEKIKEKKFDIVVTVQPTSPLLRVETLDRAIMNLVDNGMVDTIISVVDDRHLSWTVQDGKSVPKYEKRLNRQYLPKEFRETGAILATKRRCITENSRIGKSVDLIEVSKNESIDIDSYEDWWVAEKLLKRKKILIRTDATNEIGTGHVYRQLYIASRIMDHEVIFLMNTKNKLGVNLVKGSNFSIITFNDNESEKILEVNPDIIINDILDTSDEYMSFLKERNIFSINFEDMGEGAKKADLVFNALYEYRLPLKNIYGGHKYYILRDEFKEHNKKIVNRTVNKMLVTFGGSDPNNFTEKVIDIIDNHYKDINIDIILGLGYKEKEKIRNKYKDNDKISIFDSVKNISKYMYGSDIVVTSGGRTMYEVASLGIPCLVLCQNERELTHLFGHAGNGIINLGLGEHLTEGMIKNTIGELIENYELRSDMNAKMKSIDLEHGFDNIIDVVTTEYSKFKSILLKDKGEI